jgi:large subunit ribosomal protein L10
MAKPEKVAAVAELAESFRGYTAAVLTEYRGLTVSQLTELRRSLGEGAQYAVVKNTLTKIAAKQAGIDGLDALLAGPTAVAFVTGDPVVAAKGLRDFARTNPALIVKGGYVEGRAMSADEMRRLADLESREVLLSKLAGAMNGTLVQAVSLFAAPLSQAARLVEALRAKREAEAPAAEAPTPDAPVEAAPETVGA